MIRRLPDWRSTFDDDDPVVYILAPEVSRPVPAGDTRRGTAWLFRSRDDAARFGEWVRVRHNLETTPVGVKMRELARALAPKDLTWILDPEPRAGYGDPMAFKAPLEN